MGGGAFVVSGLFSIGSGCGESVDTPSTPSGFACCHALQVKGPLWADGR
nr:MAG TPA: hypothetical protein [Caudoviricetes sp.]